MQKNLNKFSLLFSVVLMTVLFSVVSVMAVTTTTIVTPGATDALRGVSIVNVTVANPIENFSCAVYAKSTSTANSSWSVIIADSTNYSALNWNGTFNTNVLEDANNYQINVSCHNSTARKDTATAATVIIDNQSPSAATTPIPSNLDTVTNGTFTFGSSVTGTQTTACTLFFDGKNPGSKSYSMTHSGDACTYSFASDEIAEESYIWWVQTTDASNYTNSSKWTVNIDKGTGTAKYAALLEEPGVRPADGATLSVGDGLLDGDIKGIPKVAILILVIVVIVVLIIKYKKK